MSEEKSNRPIHHHPPFIFLDKILPRKQRNKILYSMIKKNSQEIEQAMKTLFSVELTLPYITTPPSLHWQPKSSILYKNRSQIHTKTWKIEAKPKGFNGETVQKQKLITKEEEKKTKQEDPDDKIEDVVMQRIITRILVNVGVPLVTGLALLQVFSVIKENNLWQIPRWLPFLTIFITFGASTLGIAYGALSTSWEADKKGSILGFEEARENWVRMWEEDGGDN